MNRARPPVRTLFLVMSLLSLAPCASAGALQPGPGIRFANEATIRGITMRTLNGDPARKYIIETLGSGAAMFDYDVDGDIDIFLVQGSQLEPAPRGTGATSRLYENDGAGTFKDVTAGSGLEIPFWGFGTAAADFDNDGDPDLFVTAWGPDHLFRNDGAGHFTDISGQAGIADPRFGTSAAFFDYDGDASLDLYVANYITFDPESIPVKGDPNSPCTFRGLAVMCGPRGLPGAAHALYHNNGDGTFTNVARVSGLVEEGDHYGLGVITSDLDSDGHVDLLVANDSTPNLYYRNLGNGRFQDDGLMSGFAYSNDGREQAGMGIDTGDVDADGDIDVFVTNFSHDYSTLRLNDGHGLLEDVSVRVGLAEPTMMTLGWGTALTDLDNDGDVDIFLANGHVYPEVEGADIGTTYRQANQVFENLGSLRFRELLWGAGPESGSPGGIDLHRSMAQGDVDNDGRVDLLVTVLNGQPELLMNRGADGHWLDVHLVGRASNRDGVGALLTLSVGGKTSRSERRGGGSYLAAPSPVVHFGVGAATSVDWIEVRWPSGTVQRIPSPRLNTILKVVEPTTLLLLPTPDKSASGKNHPP